jgi:hypothetical protein
MCVKYNVGHSYRYMADSGSDTEVEVAAPRHQSTNRPKRPKTQAKEDSSSAAWDYDPENGTVASHAREEWTKALTRVLQCHGEIATTEPDCVRQFYMCGDVHSVTYSVERTTPGVCGHGREQPAGSSFTMSLLYPARSPARVHFNCITSAQCGIVDGADVLAAAMSVLNMEREGARDAVAAWVLIEKNADGPHGHNDEGCRVATPTVRDFNRLHFMLDNGATFYSVDEHTGELTPRIKQHFATRFQNLQALPSTREPTAFTTLWCSSKHRRLIRRLEKIPPPLMCPPKVYNTWTPFTGEVLLHNGVQPDMEAAAKFEQHCSIMVSHKKDHLKYLLDWFAQLLQQPAIVPGTALVFKSKPGSGKGITMRAFIRVIGRQHGMSTNTVDDIFGKYNHLLEMMLIDFDDVPTRDMYANDEKFKSLITDAQFGVSIRRMFTDPRENVKCYPRFTTKGQNGVNAAVDDRRFVVFDVSNEACGNLKYGEDMDQLFSRPESTAGIYTALMARDLTGVRLTERPQTQAVLAMQSSNVPSHVRLLHLIAQGPLQPCLVQLGTNDQAFPDVVSITSECFADLHVNFWNKYYSKRDKTSSAIDARTLSSRVIELSKDILGKVHDEQISGIRMKVLTSSKDEGKVRKQR